MMMGWWRKVTFPVKKAWAAVSARVKARKTRRGIMELRDDVQTCGYEDVQVMWEILRRSEMELDHTLKRKRLLWGLFGRCDSDNHHQHAAAAATMSCRGEF